MKYKKLTLFWWKIIDKLFGFNKPTKEMKLFVRFLKDEKVYTQTMTALTQYYQSTELFKEMRFRMAESEILMEDFFGHSKSFNIFNNVENDKFWRMLNFKWKVHCLANKDKIQISDTLELTIKDMLWHLRFVYDSDTVKKLKSYAYARIKFN